MRISDEAREKWLKVFGGQLPEAIKPFAEDEQDEHVTNGGMLAHPEGTSGSQLTSADLQRMALTQGYIGWCEANRMLGGKSKSSLTLESGAVASVEALKCFWRRTLCERLRD